MTAVESFWSCCFSDSFSSHQPLSFMSDKICNKLHFLKLESFMYHHLLWFKLILVRVLSVFTTAAVLWVQKNASKYLKFKLKQDVNCFVKMNLLFTSKPSVELLLLDCNLDFSLLLFVPTSSFVCLDFHKMLKIRFTPNKKKKEIDSYLWRMCS